MSETKAVSNQESFILPAFFSTVCRRFGRILEFYNFTKKMLERTKYTSFMVRGVSILLKFRPCKKNFIKQGCELMV